MLEIRKHSFHWYYLSLQGCQSKIQRDTTTLRSTQNLICDKDREIRKLNKELKKLQEVKNAIEKRRNRCESMKDYLEEVVRSSGNEYENVQELIARFEDLKQIRDERSQKTFHGLANRVDTLHTDQLETKVRNQRFSTKCIENHVRMEFIKKTYAKLCMISNEFLES
jgi:predicted RNase H-like nuclease (RuvC/YqgF family)